VPRSRTSDPLRAGRTLGASRGRPALAGGKDDRDAVDRDHRNAGTAVHRRGGRNGCHAAGAEERPADGDRDENHPESLTINAGRCLEAAEKGWLWPAREVIEMLTMELIVLLSGALVMLTGAMVVAQLSRERLIRPHTQPGTWR
jgi:hypothetical protein